MPEERSFLDWEPVLTPNQVYTNNIAFGFLTESYGNVYWIEGKASEKGRQTIVKFDVNTKQKTELTPKNYNARSLVHDYGGHPFAIGKNFVYFVNFLDQRIYKQNIHNLEQIEPLTPEKNSDGSVGKYMDIHVLPDENRLYFVYEQEFENNQKPKNTIAFIDLSITDQQEPQIAIEGNDFYSEFAISGDGTTCIWLTWNLPNMPWDYTELWSAKISSKGIIETKKIAGGNGESIVSPILGPENEIIFVMDFPNKKDDDYLNYWNIYRFIPKHGKYYPISKEYVEFGNPLWSSGAKTLSYLTDKDLLCIYKKNGLSKIALLDLNELKFTKLSIPYININGLASVNKNVFIIGANSYVPASIVSFEFYNNILENETIHAKALPDQYILPANEVSTGKLVKFPTKDNGNAYGYLYLPKNSKYIGKGKPPLLVLVHGGPTGNTSNSYSNYYQYWASSGFAILDIEHRGSTGFGRKYRDSLLGNWGLLEISDIEDALNFLISKNVITKKVGITGGSAGGYTVQRALTYLPDSFQVGASHCGIGNLLTLKKLMHKYEFNYLDLLIGKEEQLLVERSPVNFFDKLKSPMILFQGADDKIVPPEVSREIAEILKQKGIKSDYVEYVGEGHGFRQFDNKVDALTKESNFFKSVLRSV